MYLDVSRCILMYLDVCERDTSRYKQDTCKIHHDTTGYVSDRKSPPKTIGNPPSPHPTRGGCRAHQGLPLCSLMNQQSPTYRYARARARRTTRTALTARAGTKFRVLYCILPHPRSPGGKPQRLTARVKIASARPYFPQPRFAGGANFRFVCVSVRPARATFQIWEEKRCSLLLNAATQISSPAKEASM